jgi:hypothetical protein
MAYKALEGRTPSERMTALVLDIADLEAQLGKYGKVSDEVLVAAIAERGSNERSVYIAQRRREVPEDLPETEGKPQEPGPSSPPSSSPPPPTETKPPASAATETSAKFSEAKPAPAASTPPDKTDDIRARRVRGAYARRKHKEGGERCVQEYLKGKGKGAIEDLDDRDLKVLLDALDKLPEAGEGHGGGGGW